MEKNQLKEINAAYELLFWAASETVREFGSHPHLIVCAKEGDLTYVDCSALSSQAIAALHRHLEDFGGFNFVFLIMEAWTYEGNKDAPLSKALTSEKLKVSELPEENRGSAVIFNIRAGGEQFMAICPIDEKSKKVRMEPLKKVDPAHWSGKHIGRGDQRVH